MQILTTNPEPRSLEAFSSHLTYQKLNLLSLICGAYEVHEESLWWSRSPHIKTKLKTRIEIVFSFIFRYIVLFFS